MMFTWDFFLMAAIFGFAYGFLLQKADFCFTASIRDWFSVRDSRILNGVLVLIAVALLGWGITLTLDTKSVSDIWTVPIGGANLLGGIIFGIGMTIAGGCGSGTLYRCGMGYVQFWIVLAFMIIGNLLFALVYDPWGRDYVMEPLTISGLEEGYSLFSLPVIPLLLPVLIILIMVGIAIYRFGAKSFFHGFKEAVTDWSKNPLKQSHWDIRLVAALIGIIATIQFAVMSNFGITGPETRIGGVGLSLIFGEDFVYNNTYLNGLFADFPNIGIGPEETLIFFLIVGAFVAALLSNSFKIRWPKKSRLPYAIIGGLLMGVASRMAPGCNIANVITGVGGLSISSFIVVFGMIIGIYIAMAYIFRMPLLLFQKDFKM